MGLLRAFTALVVVAIILVAAVPLLVLLDLVGDGTGWGLCPSGLAPCRSSYFDGPELAAILTLTLFGLVGLLRLSFLMQKWWRLRVEALNERQSPPPRPAARPR